MDAANGVDLRPADGPADEKGDWLHNIQDRWGSRNAVRRGACPILSCSFISGAGIPACQQAGSLDSSVEVLSTRGLVSGQPNGIDTIFG